MPVERLAYRTPLAADALVDFLALRAIPGVEEVVDRTYRRVVTVAGRTGIVSARFEQDAAVIELEIDEALADVAGQVVEGARQAFDLDADPQAVDAVLAADPRLRPSVSALPGRRVPGAFEGFEIAVRAVLGQQISVAAARTIAGRLAAGSGKPLAEPSGSLRVAFPQPEAVALADLSGLGVPASRGATLVAVARALCEGELDLSPDTDRDVARAALLALPGVGPWTASYIAMRALHDGDAFPSSDLVLRQVLGGATAASAQAVEQQSRRWSPWRAYAVVHLWAEAAAARLARGAA